MTEEGGQNVIVTNKFETRSDGDCCGKSRPTLIPRDPAGRSILNARRSILSTEDFHIIKNVIKPGRAGLTQASFDIIHAVAPNVVRQTKTKRRIKHEPRQRLRAAPPNFAPHPSAFLPSGFPCA
eukprot:2427411-Rhodomonas_salina.1